MYRSIIFVALACVLTLASAQTKCPTYCWYSEKIAAEKCGKYPLKECMRDGVRGDTCDCSKGGSGGGSGGGRKSPTPKPTRNPSPVAPCGKFIMYKKPSPYGKSSSTTSVFIKRNRGYFVFDWASYAIKDKFVIMQGKGKIFDSNYVVGMGSNRVFLNGQGKNVAVSVMSEEGGSIWDFIAGCAKI